MGAYLTVPVIVGVLMLIGVLTKIASSSRAASSSTSSSNGKKSKEVPPANAIKDNYRNLPEVEMALRKAGLESSDLIIAIDFTKSNTWQGEKTFGGLCLHNISHIPGEFNPYQQVISTLSDVLLKKLDDDMEVPMYGFGDSHTSNRKVFLMNNEKPCHSKEELLAAYADAASNVILSGPTSFAPIIYEAIDVCKATGKYHILFIVADGMMDDVDATTQAIVAASKYPLSIVMVGVGDGDNGKWDQMDTFDDDIPDRDFDNFQFVSFTRLMLNYRDPTQRALRFATEALMELPEQYGLIKKAGLLGRAPDHRVPFANRLRGKHHFPSSFQEAGPGRREGSPGGAPPAYAPVY